MPRTRACACGLRSVWPHSIPGASRSLENTNSPLTFGTASERGVISPTRPCSRRRGLVTVCSRLGTDALPSRASFPARLKLEEAWVAPRAHGRSEASCTASTIRWYPVQRQMLPDSASRISSSVGTGLRARRSAAATTRPGRAETTLHRSRFDERLLHGVQSILRSQALHRHDVVVVHLSRQHEARAHEHTVEQHRARSALALLARVLRAR